MLIPTPKQEVHIDRMMQSGRLLDRSEAGSGKTLVALEAFRHLSGAIDRVLIIAPKIVVRQWERRAREQMPELADQIELVETSSHQWRADARVLIMSPGMVRNDSIYNRLQQWGHHLLIVDEAHMLKSPTADITQRVLGIGPYRGLTKRAMYIWLLTGTPIRRYPDDLWPILRYVWPEFIRPDGSRYPMDLRAFQERYLVMKKVRIAGGAVIDKPVAGRNLDQLGDILKQISIVRTLEDMRGELPDVTRGDLWVDVDEHKVYEALLEDDPIAAEYYKEEDLGTFEDRLREMLSNEDSYLSTVRRVIAIQKAGSGRLADFICDLEEPVLVYAWHREAMNTLATRLWTEGVVTELIDGGTNPDVREDIVKRFAEGEVPVLIGQIGAMGTGLDGLQDACHHAVFMEQDFSPALNHQAVARLDRLGQMYPVHVDYVRSDTLIDHLIHDAISAKNKMLAELEIE